ncbi:MAG: ribosomal L7Ae/L30e/S12e/Gadd45 family protein [Bacillota bacterium]|nr:ribosomal L7Ae/L30e/S12e/Gadd45 family protein [Bacillota bacterium]
MRLAGLAKRAGRLIHGTTAVRQSLATKARLLLLASDAACRTQRDLSAAAGRRGVPVYMPGNRHELGRCCGTEETVALAIEDEGFAAAIREALE